MGLRVVTLVPDLRLLEGTVNLQSGVDARLLLRQRRLREGSALSQVSAVLSGQVPQAGRSNWAEGPGPGREWRAGRRRRSRCWSPRWRRRRSWGPLLSGLNPWTAAGECSWWLEGGHWGVPSGPRTAPRSLCSSSPWPRPYLCLPLRHRKPCVRVWSRWENHTWRLRSSNCVRKVAERLVRVRRAPTGRGWARGASGRPWALKGALELG